RHAAFEIALAHVPGEADQRILLGAPRHRDAIVDPHARLEADKTVFARNLFEHHGAAVVIGARLAAAVVIDDQQRIARRDEPPAVAILRELHVAIALARAGISLGMRAGVAF